MVSGNDLLSWRLFHILLYDYIGFTGGLSCTVELVVGPLVQNTSLIISGVHIFLSNQLLSMCLEKAAEIDIGYFRIGKLDKCKSH